jgi:hypothetical protein
MLSSSMGLNAPHASQRYAFPSTCNSTIATSTFVSILHLGVIRYFHIHSTLGLDTRNLQ